MSMDTNGLQKVVELGLNASKVAANLSEVAKQRDKNPQPNNPPKKESTNQPHNQTVEVKVGELTGNNQMPKIIKEKTEEHIHKHYPDNREMSKDECELEKYRIEMEFKEKEADRQFRALMAKYDRDERREREEYARKQDELRKQEAKKQRRTNRIIGGVLVGLGLGLTGYCVYTDIRANRGDGLALQAPSASLRLTSNISTKPAKHKNLIKAEGIVE